MSTVTIDLNQPCLGCGRLGRVIENQDGLCLTCLGEQTVVSPRGGRADEGLRRPQIDQTQRPAGRWLAGSLFDLIVRAERAADQKFHSLPLQGGLFVEIGLGEHFNLRLYRRTCAPSACEWQTVIDYLPAAYRPEATILPRDYKHVERDGSVRWYLEGHWPFRQR